MGMKSMHSEVAKLDFRKGRGKSCFCVGDPWAFIKKSIAM